MKIVNLVALSIASLVGFFTGWHINSDAGNPARKLPIQGSYPSQQFAPAAPNNDERFHWSQLESDDFSKYIANLRRIGCPEPIITAIIKGRLFADAQARVNAIFNPLSRYWSSPQELKAVDDEIALIRAQRDQSFRSLDLDTSTEITDDGLSVEQHKHVAEANKLFSHMALGPSATPEQWGNFLANRAARVQYLAQYMSPDELLTYRINQDGNALGIGQLINSINPSDSEFTQAFSQLDGEDLSRTNGFLRPDLEAKLQSALGDTRYAEYQQQMLPGNFLFNSFVQDNLLTADQISSLRNARSTFGTDPGAVNNVDYINAVAQVIGNARLTAKYFQMPVLYMAPSK
jgi:hypothetical protein